MPSWSLARRTAEIMLLSAVWVLSEAGGVSGQGGADGATLAALAAIRPSIGPGAVALDVSALCEAELADWRCPPEVSDALERLRLRAGSSEFTHVCPSGPGSCQLVGVRHFIIPTAPRVRGDSAQIDLTVISSGTGGDRLIEESSRVHLARRSGRWTVVRVDDAR